VSDEYPRFHSGQEVQYRTSVGGWKRAVYVAVDPTQPLMCVLRGVGDSKSRAVVVSRFDVRLLPSPDDIVEVTVEMTRAQRDASANGTWPALAHQIVAACRAHRDAEA
jgi:hypothetical protein